MVLRPGSLVFDVGETLISMEPLLSMEPLRRGPGRAAGPAAVVRPTTTSRTSWTTTAGHRGPLVQACVQHNVLDPEESAELTVLLPVPSVGCGRSTS